jgi:hypothetical protein
MKRTTNIYDIIVRQAPFTWGEMVSVEAVGEYHIAIYHPWKAEKSEAGVSYEQDVPNEDKILYHGWVNGKDTCQSWESLDAALAGCIAYKHEGPNHGAGAYFMRMITKQ